MERAAPLASHEPDTQPSIHIHRRLFFLLRTEYAEAGSRQGGIPTRSRGVAGAAPEGLLGPNLGGGGRRPLESALACEEIRCLGSCSVAPVALWERGRKGRGDTEALSLAQRHPERDRRRGRRHMYVDMYMYTYTYLLMFI